MPAYVISRVTPKRGQALDRYRRLAEASIVSHGGRYLARGGGQEILEGDWSPATIIVEFPSVEAARRWYRSSDYKVALAIRDEALSRDLIVVEGMELSAPDGQAGKQGS